MLIASSSSLLSLIIISPLFFSASAGICSFPFFASDADSVRIRRLSGAAPPFGHSDQQFTALSQQSRGLGPLENFGVELAVELTETLLGDLLLFE